eukprot:3346853-Amphidinium_carterae.1
MALCTVSWETHVRLSAVLFGEDATMLKGGNGVLRNRTKRTIERNSTHKLGRGSAKGERAVILQGCDVLCQFVVNPCPKRRSVLMNF